MCDRCSVGLSVLGACLHVGLWQEDRIGTTWSFGEGKLDCTCAEKSPFSGLLGKTASVSNTATASLCVQCLKVFIYTSTVDV